MKTTIQFVVALLVAAMMAALFRAFAFTMYTVEGRSLEPELLEGDRVLVNRWSYGLRTGGDGSLFSYGRVLASPVERGDLVAFDLPGSDGHEVLVCRCKHLPGDTLHTKEGVFIVPGKTATCATEDFYWMEAVGADTLYDSRTFGPVAESSIIGRVCLVVYSRDYSHPLLGGFRKERTLLLK